MADDSAPDSPIRRMVAASVQLAADRPAEAPAVTEVLMLINQLAAALGPDLSHPRAATDAERRVADLLRAAADLLTRQPDLLTRQPDQVAYVTATANALNDLAQAGHLHPAAVPTATQPAPRRRSGAQTHYYRHEGARGVRLVETRESDIKDFFVTEPDYHAAVEALATAAANAPATFDQLHRRFLQAGGTKTTSGYPLRVVLRFLRAQHPPLIQGARGNYRLAGGDIAAFKQQAAAAWDALPHRTRPG